MLSELLALGAGLDQGDMSSAKGTFLGWISCSGCTKATEEGQVEVYFLLAAVDKHPNTNDNTPKFCYSAYRLSDRASRGEDVINNKNVFAGGNFKIASEDSYFPFLFGKNAPHP